MPKNKTHSGAKKRFRAITIFTARFKSRPSATNTESNPSSPSAYTLRDNNTALFSGTFSAQPAGYPRSCGPTLSTNRRRAAV